MMNPMQTLNERWSSLMSPPIFNNSKWPPVGHLKFDHPANNGNIDLDLFSTFDINIRSIAGFRLTCQAVFIICMRRLSPGSPPSTWGQKNGAKNTNICMQARKQAFRETQIWQNFQFFWNFRQKKSHIFVKNQDNENPNTSARS